jgi:hypothetical protein
LGLAERLLDPDCQISNRAHSHLRIIVDIFLLLLSKAFQNVSFDPFIITKIAIIQDIGVVKGHEVLAEELVGDLAVNLPGS